MKESVVNQLPSRDARPPQRTRAEPPTVRGQFLAGVLPEFRRDALALNLRIMREHGDFVRVYYGPFPAYHITHPDYVKQILIDNNQNYRRNKQINEMLKFVSGEHLFTSDGEMWRKQRRLMQPAFHRKRIDGFSNMMTENTKLMLDRWASLPPNQPLDVDAEIKTLTFTIVGLALFGVDLADESNGMGDLMTSSMEYLAYRMGTLLAPPLWVPTKRNRAFKAGAKKLENLGPQLVRDRRAEIAQNGTADESGRQFDMMDLLLDARYEDTGEAMSDEQLITEVQTMLGAGHETTANSLSLTFYLLSQHPEIAARVRAEVDAVLGDRIPTVADLPQLTYLKMVIHESLRIYPTAWTMGRQSVAADQFGPYELPADVGVQMPIYAIHRHPDFWDDPERFDPERFAPTKAQDIHRFAYFPFGGGPRQCIGNGFALMESQLILAMVLQRYELHIVPDHPITVEPLISLRFKHGLMMTLAAR